jgi:hypothetical protein
VTRAAGPSNDRPMPGASTPPVRGQADGNGTGRSYQATSQ